MKKSTALAAFMLFGFASLSAQSTICYYEINSNNANFRNTNGDMGKALLSWENGNNGEIVISIAPYGNNPCEVKFRNNSLQDPANQIKINNIAIGASGTGYFSFSNSADMTKFVLTPTPLFDAWWQALPEDNKTVTVTYNNTIRYQVRNNKTIGFDLQTVDAPNTSFVYTYGANCGTTFLTTPSITSIADDGTITFPSVANATGYRVFVKKGDNLIYMQNIANSGDKINITIPDTYTVVLRALDNTVTYREKESAEYTWTCVNAGSVPAPSPFCAYLINPAPNTSNPTNPLLNVEQATADDSDAVYLTLTFAETAGSLDGVAYQAGDLLTILTTYIGDDAHTKFNNGLNLYGFKVGGLNGNDVLQKVSSNQKKIHVFRPKTGITIPNGTPISYYGEFRYYANHATNQRVLNITLDGFQWGATCVSSQLMKPNITSIANNGTVTFSPLDENATGFAVSVKNGMTEVYTQTLTGSGQQINFSTLGTYNVTITAIDETDEYENSEPSNIYVWNILPTLATPEISDITAAGVITFAPVDANAVNFQVIVKNASGTTVSTTTVSGSGQTVPSPSYAGNYDVTVQAIGNGTTYISSEVSAAYSWFATPPPAPDSKVCYYQIADGNANIGDAGKAYVTWETGYSGEIILRLHSYGNNPCEVTWRDNHLENIPVNFKINGNPNGSMTSEINATQPFFNWDLSADKTKLIFTPTITFDDFYMPLYEADAKVTVTYTGPIRFKTRRTLTYGRDLTSLDANNLSFTYTYSANCGNSPLATPVITNIAGDGTLTFAPVPNATGYRVFVRKDDYQTPYIYIQNIANSGDAVNVKIPDNYKVMLRALDNTSTYTESESEEYAWTCVNAGSTAGGSIYCSWFYNPAVNSTNNPLLNFAQSTADDSDGFYMTWETAQEAGELLGVKNYGGSPFAVQYQAGDLIVSLSTYTGDDGETRYRGSGIQAKDFYVGGLNSEFVFDKININDPAVTGWEYNILNNSKYQLFRPKQGVTVPQGTVVNYFGQVELRANNKDLVGNMTFNNYKYGSICNANQLIQPNITSITNGGVITFSPADNRATGFLVSVKNGSAEVYNQTVTASEETLNFSTIGTYNVTITAIGATPYVNSEVSEIYVWTIRPQLPTPTITNISNLGVITFAPADANASAFQIVIKNSVDAMVRTENVAGSGATIFVPQAAGTYSVTVQAKGDDVWLNSEVSAQYYWVVNDNLDYSGWCKRYVNSGNQEDDKDAALFSIETGENGELIITIEGVNGHNATFRNDGIYGALQNPTALNSFSVGTKNANNGSNYFEKDYTFNNIVDKQVFTLKEGVTIPSGTHIWFDGNIEFASSLSSELTALTGSNDILPTNSNIWGRFRFEDYIYGTNCNSAPKISVDKQFLKFTPQMSAPNILTVTGENLLGAVNVEVPAGYRVEPSVLTPSNGIVNQQITVYWDGGFYHYRRPDYYSGQGVITFNGGGVNSLHNAPRVAVFGYQMGCTYYNNYFLGNGGGSPNQPAYLSMNLNADSTVLFLNISPTEPTGNAFFQNDAVSGGNVKVNGNSTAVTRELINDNKTIKLTFPSRLNLGDVLSFRDCSPQQNLKWTISDYPQQWNNTIGSETTLGNPFGNGSVALNNWNQAGRNEGYATFYVGEACVSVVAPYILNAEKNIMDCYTIPETDIALGGHSAKILLNILQGTYPIASVTFIDVNNTQNPPIVFNQIPEDKRFEISGLDVSTSYIYNIVVKDNHNNENYVIGADASCPNVFVSFETTDGTPVQLQTPVIESITETGVITFAPADANADNFEIVVKNADGQVVHTQPVSGSGATINYSTAGVYSVTVQAKGDGVDFANSEISEPYQWTITGNLAKPVIEYISAEGVITFAPVDENAAGFTVTITNANGDVVHSQTVSGSGATVNFSTEGVWNVTVTAVGSEIYSDNTSDAYVWTILAQGLWNTNDDVLVIYPNPVNSELTISLIAIRIELTENDVIEIFDISGRVVAMHALPLRETLTINVSALPQGVYFIKIGTKTAKFIKK